MISSNTYNSCSFITQNKNRQTKKANLTLRKIYNSLTVNVILHDCAKPNPLLTSNHRVNERVRELSIIFQWNCIRIYIGNSPRYPLSPTHCVKPTIEGDSRTTLNTRIHPNDVSALFTQIVIGLITHYFAKPCSSAAAKKQLVDLTSLGAV